MNLRLLSDLHLEHHPDGGQAFVAALPAADVDVLVVAGDLCARSQLLTALSALAARFPRVVYVAGNHELYGSSFPELRETLALVRERLPTVHVLDNEAVEVDGVRFVGGTLWFPEAPRVIALERQLNDFRLIQDFRERVYDENRAGVRFLVANLREGDVVVTHHLPSHACVAAQYLGHPLTRFFVCAMDGLIVDRRPRLWVHGHTHASVDVRVGATRVVANPFGYWRHERNEGFRADATVVVDNSGVR